VLTLQENLQQTVFLMPKVELHRHLEGSLRLSTLVEIAQQYGMEVEDEDTLRPFVQMMPNEPRNPSRFLSKFYTLRQFYRTQAIVERLVTEVIEDAAADHIHYLELRFTPRALCNMIGCPMAEMVELVCQAGSAAAERAGIDVRYIVSINRHEAVELGEAALAAALKCRSRGVVALDLAGDEVNYPVHPFCDIFQQAHREGLYITVHAGEWAGSQSIRDALEVLGAHRIGHGLNVIHDAALTAELAQRGTALELCPTSNVLSGIVEGLSTHPVHALTQRGVTTTLNTDDPLVCNVTLSQEMLMLMKTFQLTLEDLKQYMLRAARNAFLSVEERQQLIQTLQTQYTTIS
jgi:adenosine deaminase